MSARSSPGCWRALATAASRSTPRPSSEISSRRLSGEVSTKTEICPCSGFSAHIRVSGSSIPWSMALLSACTKTRSSAINRVLEIGPPPPRTSTSADLPICSAIRSACTGQQVNNCRASIDSAASTIAAARTTSPAANADLRSSSAWGSNTTPSRRCIKLGSIISRTTRASLQAARRPSNSAGSTGALPAASSCNPVSNSWHARCTALRPKTPENPLRLWSCRISSSLSLRSDASAPPARPSHKAAARDSTSSIRRNRLKNESGFW